MAAAIALHFDVDISARLPDVGDIGDALLTLLEERVDDAVIVQNLEASTLGLACSVEGVRAESALETALEALRDAVRQLGADQLEIRTLHVTPAGTPADPHTA